MRTGEKKQKKDKNKGMGWWNWRDMGGSKEEKGGEERRTGRERGERQKTTERRERARSDHGRRVRGIWLAGWRREEGVKEGRRGNKRMGERRDRDR